MLGNKTYYSYHFLSTFLFVLLSGSIKAYAQIIENPFFDRTDYPAFHVNKIVITKDTTCLFCSYNADTDSWANISKDTYLRDVNTNKIYPLLKCEGLPYGPDRRTFAYSEKCEIKLFFKSISNGSKYDLIENIKKRAFNVFGIDLNNQYKEKYVESYLNRLLNMSSFYDSAGDTIKSIQYKKELIEAQRYTYGILSDVTFFSLLGLCVLYDKFGYQKEAINLIRELSRLQETPWGESSIEFALLRRIFAENYLISSYYDKIIETVKDAISLYEKLNIVDNVYAFLLRYNAYYYSIIGDEKNFVAEQKKCLDIRRILGNGKLYMEDLFILYIWNSSPDVYVERLNIVEKEMENLPSCVDQHSLDYVFFLGVISPMFNRVGKYQKAIDISDNILSVLEKDFEGNVEKIAEAQSEKIRNLNALGKYDEAISLGERIKGKCDSLKIRPKVYKTIVIDLAESYNKMFNYEKAIPLIDQLIEINQKEEDWLSLTRMLYMNGNNCKNKKDFVEAERYLKEALDIISHHDNAEEYLRKQYIYEPETIIDPNEELARYIETITHSKLSIYAILGFVSSAKDQYKDAIDYEIKAGDLYKEIMDKSTDGEIDYFEEKKGYAYHLVSLSSYYSKNKQYVESNDCAMRSIEYFNSCDSALCYHSYLQLATNMCLVNKVDSAIYYANEALSIAKTSGRIKNISDCLIRLAYILVLKDNYNMAEKCLSEALNNLQSTIKYEIIDMTNEQKQRLWDMNEYLFLYYRYIVTKCESNSELYSKLLNYTLFSKSLLLDSNSSNKEHSKRKLSMNWHEIQNNLTDKDIAIEFITTKADSINKAYYALVVDKYCVNPNMIYLFTDSYYETMKRTVDKNDIDLLGNIVWKAILVQYEQIQNIYFSPDGIIHKTPIEYSNVDGIGEINEHYNFYRLSSTKEIVNPSQQEINNSAILYGGLDYDMLANVAGGEKGRRSLLRSINERGGFEPLNNTLEEVKEISSLLKGKKVNTTLYSGEEGTEGSFKGLSGKGVNMLHLSTHGMYVEPENLKQKKHELNYDFLELISNDDDPVKEDIVLTHSFLVMSGGNSLSHRDALVSGMNDGILTAFEISHVDLSSVDIVVLSACETGLGDIENGGVYGLQRGFKKAGVNTILMSIDKVDDEATKILMVEFYRNLMSGKSKHQSLKDAQKYLRQVDNGKYNKPEYWASFILLDGLN